MCRICHRIAVLSGNMTDMILSEKDEELLALLKLNAREPVASLARKLGVSRSTIQDRLHRLESQGVIAGYSVRLTEQAEKGIRAYVTIEAEPRRAADVARALQKLPQIETLHTVSGKFDLVAFASARTTEEMDRMLDQIGSIQGVTGTESAMILSTKLDRR
jgi:DNA-binding Lrp family transcriptional regulator